jgi:hypothetical protein
VCAARSFTTARIYCTPRLASSMTWATPAGRDS